MRRSLLIIALTGCVSANANIRPNAPITEIASVPAYMNESALNAIKSMRPRWLENDPQIIVNGVPTSRMTLETLHTNEIREVRYTHATDDARAIVNIVMW